MKLALSAGGVLALAGLAGAGFLVWKLSRVNVGGAIADGVEVAVAAVNPFNPDNLAAKAANGVVTAVAGRPETVGGALWEVDAWLEAKRREWFLSPASVPGVPAVPAEGDGPPRASW